MEPGEAVYGGPVHMTTSFFIHASDILGLAGGLWTMFHIIRLKFWNGIYQILVMLNMLFLTLMCLERVLMWPINTLVNDTTILFQTCDIFKTFDFATMCLGAAVNSSFLLCYMLINRSLYLRAPIPFTVIYFNTFVEMLISVGFLLPHSVYQDEVIYTSAFCDVSIGGSSQRNNVVYACLMLAYAVPLLCGITFLILIFKKWPVLGKVSYSVRKYHSLFYWFSISFLITNVGYVITLIGNIDGLIFNSLEAHHVFLHLGSLQSFVDAVMLYNFVIKRWSSESGYKKISEDFNRDTIYSSISDSHIRQKLVHPVEDIAA